MNKYRTHNCADLSEKEIDENVILSGWLHRKRDHGNLLFIDLRDHYGITQCVIENNNNFFPIIEKSKPESVLTISGKVVKRSSGTENLDLKTGKIEISEAGLARVSFTGKTFTTDEPTFVFENPVFQSKILLPLCSEVEVGRAYLQNRGIDPTKFYFAEKFKTFANSYKKVFASTSFEESRIIIPLFYNQNLIGFQGRALGRSKVKYITVMLDDNAPKIYGLDTINTNLPIYVVEGPFDSTFLNNSVALCGADGNLSCLEGSDCVYTFDNEPRNGEIVGRIRGAISRG